MATKKNQTSQLQNTVTVLKEKATQLNEELLLTSEELIEGTISNGERVQDIMAKVLNNGTYLLGKQQDLAFYTIERLIGQYKTGNVKFRKLLGFDKYTARKAKAQKSIKKAILKKRNQVKAKTTASIDAILTETTVPAKPVAKKAKKKSSTRKVKATKKVSHKVKTTKTADLTVIEGIGPKIASLLNNAGINTFKQLGKTEVTKLKEILAAAGNRYNAHDPTTWGQQAELAAAGKWEVLKAWKNRLKGGVSDASKRVVVL